MQEITYRIYADESVSNGKYYSNFYGGALAKVTDIQDIEKALNNKKEELNLYSEIKWIKVTENYLDKYIEMINLFFSFIKEGKIEDEKTGRRSKRTKAKEKLYKIINSNIREIRKNFNVGITTGISENQFNYWKDPYRHWNFISSYSHFDETLTKKEIKRIRKNKAPLILDRESIVAVKTD